MVTQFKGSQLKAGTIFDTQIAASANIATSKLADGSLFIKSDGSVAFTADLSLGGNKLTNVAAPVSDSDGVNKLYVDSVAQGLDVKQSVRVATTANISLSGTQTIDGVAVVAGNRVLVKNQTDASENGIYVVAAGAWSRSADADNSPSGGEVTSGLFTFVEEGSMNGNLGFVLANADPITLGTTELVFTQFSGAGQVTAGAGLTKTGNQLDIGAGDGISVAADSISVDVASLAGYGLEDDGANNLQISSSMAGDGLTGGSGSPFAVGAGDGIEVSADAITVALDGTTLTKSGSGVRVNADLSINSLDLAAGASVGGDLSVIGNTNMNGNVTLGDAAADILTVNATLSSNLEVSAGVSLGSASQVIDNVYASVVKAEAIHGGTAGAGAQVTIGTDGLSVVASDLVNMGSGAFGNILLKPNAADANGALLGGDTSQFYAQDSSTGNFIPFKGDGFYFRTTGPRILSSTDTSIEFKDENQVAYVDIQADDATFATVTTSGNATIGGSVGVTGDLSVTGMATLENQTTVNGELIVNNNITATGNLAVDGVASLNGNVMLGSDANDVVSIQGKVDTSIIPATDSMLDIGSDTERYANVYADNVDTAALKVDNLSGVLKATAGVVSGSATLDDIADGTTYARVLSSKLLNGEVIALTSTTGNYDLSFSSNGDYTLEMSASVALDQNLRTSDAPTFSQITLSNAPTNASDAATKAYVDSVSQGLDVKASVRAATTANVTLSGTQTIDGVALIANDRVLVKNQSTASENGIYVVAAGAWSRASDADSNADVTSGMFTFVEEGSVNADSGWVLSTDNPITLGTTSLSFAQFSGAGQVSAGAGLTKTGNTLDVGAGDGISVAADSVAVNVSDLVGFGIESDGSNNFRISAAAAGAGLTGGAGSALAVGAGDGIQVDADAVTVKLDGSTLTKGASGLKVSDNLTLPGNLSVNGNSILGDANTDTLTINATLSSDIIPTTDDAVDLGSAAKRFNEIYVNIVKANQIDTGGGTGPVIKDNSGTVEIRNAADTDYAPLKASAITATTSMTIDSLGGVLKASSGLVSGNATMDDMADGATYGRVKLSSLTSGEVTKLTDASGDDLTVALGGANRVLTLGANVSINQNLTTTSTPTFGQLTLSNAPTNASDATTKSYVDTLVAGAAPTVVYEEIGSTITAGTPHTIPGSATYFGDAPANGADASFGKYLHIYLNGQMLVAGGTGFERDYKESGTDATGQSSVTFEANLVAGDVLKYVIYKA